MYDSEKPKLMPSIIDRLVDSSYAKESATTWYNEQELILSVERDLEELLNARQTYVGLEAFTVLQKTIVGYGLPDSSKFDLEIPQSRLQFVRTVEAVIREFEPRVRDIHITMLNNDDEKLRKLQFRIDARLKVEPASNVSFETTLQVATGHYEVKHMT